MLTLTSGFVPACTRTTIKVADERGPVTEERRKRDPEAPLFRSEWQVRPDHIDGHLTWQYCERERWWTTKRVKTVKHEALKAPGAAFIGGGTVVGFLGVASMDRDHPNADNTGPLLLETGGAVLAIAGIAMLAGKSDTTTETLSESREHDLKTGACLPSRDFAELLLVLKVGRALWPVRLSPQGDAHVEVPEGTQVPAHVDLELTVFRAPSGAADLLEKGDVLETLRLSP